LHEVDKFTSKKYAKTINHLAKVIKFLQNIKFKERGLNSNPPLAYALGSQFHNGFATVRRDNLYFTTLLWQNNGRQNGHISRTI